MVPTGTILMFGRTTAPSGFLNCDGSAVSRTAYADLFSVIGTTFGNGDGATTFNVPDLVGRLPVGAGGAEHNQEGPLGTTDGHTNIEDRRLNHQHFLDGDGGRTKEPESDTAVWVRPEAAQTYPPTTDPVSGAVSVATGDHFHGLTEKTALADPVPPFCVVGFIIKE